MKFAKKIFFLFYNTLRVLSFVGSYLRIGSIEFTKNLDLGVLQHALSFPIIKTGGQIFSGYSEVRSAGGPSLK